MAEQKSHICEYPGCNKICSNKGNLKIHQAVHSDIKPFVCDFPDCIASYKLKGHLTIHQKNHTGEKPYACDFKNCDKKFTNRGDLSKHKKFHDNLRQYVCDYPDCNQSCNTAGNLKSHQMTHTDEKIFKCPIEGCERSFKKQEYLNKHQRVHDGIRNYICDYPDCGKTFPYHASLKQHKDYHNNNRPFVCDYENCLMAFTQKANLEKHKLTHTDILPYLCPHELCDSRFRQPEYLRIHIKRMHDAEGIKRRKLQEERMRKMLTLWNYDWDDNKRFDIKSNDCISDGDKYRAFVDFILYSFVAIIILEVDEKSHGMNTKEVDTLRYLLPCENSRMMQIIENIRISGDERPIIFIRYSPNGAYKVEGKNVQISRIHREVILNEILHSICVDNKLPKDQEISIKYLYYNENKDGRPDIIDDPEYSELLKEMVVY